MEPAEEPTQTSTTNDRHKRMTQKRQNWEPKSDPEQPLKPKRCPSWTPKGSKRGDQITKKRIFCLLLEGSEKARNTSPQGADEKAPQIPKRGGPETPEIAFWRA